MAQEPLDDGFLVINVMLARDLEGVRDVPLQPIPLVIHVAPDDRQVMVFHEVDHQIRTLDEGPPPLGTLLIQPEGRDGEQPPVRGATRLHYVIPTTELGQHEDAVVEVAEVGRLAAGACPG